MEYSVEIKNNILYVIPTYTETGQTVMIPISKIDILGPITYKYQRNSDDSKLDEGRFYYAFSLSVGREYLEIKTTLIEEDSGGFALSDEMENLKEMRKKIVDAMEKQYSGYILDKPQKIKIKK